MHAVLLRSFDVLRAVIVVLMLSDVLLNQPICIAAFRTKSTCTNRLWSQH